jgi:5'-nucleotidase
MTASISPSGPDRRPRLLLTNDDGIDSTGLHVLARAMAVHGDVVVIAPDREYSGAGAALGALHLMKPEAQRVHLDGVAEAWAVSGPPALCVLFARLGAFGEQFDLVVSGINPGANVGRSVYHSGTVGACLSGRNGGISGVAVSQAVSGFGVEGQGWDEMLVGQRWHTAAEVASVVVGGLLAAMPADPVVVNVNVPNCDVSELRGWRHTVVGTEPPRKVAVAELVPKEGHHDAFHVRMEWGDAVELPAHTDGGAVEADLVSITYLSRLEATTRDDLGALDGALSAVFSPAVS